LKTESVLAVYSSHFLEHLNWWEGMIFLKEMYRILKMGGAMRIVVPNGDYFIDRFYNKDETFFRDSNKCYNHWVGNLTDTFVWNFLGAYYTKKRNFGCHAMFYNYDNLKYRLKMIGFCRIQKKSFNISDYNDFQDEFKFFSDRKIPRELVSNSLFVECFK